MRNKTLLGLSPMSMLMLAAPVSADTKTEISAVKQQLNKINVRIDELDEKQANKNIIHHITDYFTGDKEDELTVKLEAERYELQSDLQVLQLQDTIEQGKALNQKVVELTKKSKEIAQQKINQKEEEKRKAEEAARAEEQRKSESEQRKAETEQVKESTTLTQVQTSVTHNGIEFGSDGLLVMNGTSAAQNVVNKLLSIPGHSNGSYYHQTNGIDVAIDGLTTPEALWVLWRIEGSGFGQTGAGLAGFDTPESHQGVVNQQINGRFGGSIHALLKAWGTFSYGGY